MKKRVLLLTGAFLTAIVLLTINACKKSDTTTPDTSTTSATDNNTADTRNTEVVNIGSQAIDNSAITTMKGKEGLGGVLTPQSGTVSVTGDTSGRIFTVIFTAFVGMDGHLRNGKIVYDYTGSYRKAYWYRDSGLVLNITTPGNTYTVDGNTIEINTKTIKNLGRITSGNLTWNDNSNITIVQTGGKGTIQWQCNRTQVLLNTNAINYTADDGTSGTSPYPAVFNGYGGGALNCINWPEAIVSFSGSFNGTASDGTTYTGSVSTSSPLILNFNCTPMYTRFVFNSGILTFTPAGKLTRTINYGNGVCDMIVNVSIGSWNTNITL
jgi:hypothetical protein